MQQPIQSISSDSAATSHGGNAWWVPLVIAAAMGLCAVSADSFWIDEAHCARWAAAPDLHGLWIAIREIVSDTQMLLYGGQLWVWGRLAPRGEWLLRLNNVLWLWVALTAWFYAVPRRLRPMTMGLVALSPFVWAYVNELRPYMMLFAGASLMAGGLARCIAGPVSKGSLWAAAAGGVIAMGATSAAIPWIPAALAGVLWLAWRDILRLSKLGMAGLILLALGISLLDASVFFSGGKAVSPTPSTVASVAFIPYELYGFLGLGPSRGSLRTAPWESLRAYVPALSMLAAAFAAVALAGLSRFRQRVGTRAAVAWAVLLALPAVAVVGLGCSSGLRTTGRHLTPILPFTLPLLILGVDRLWSRKALWARLAVFAFFACWAASSLEIRFAARHKKDNYREAAALASTALAAGERVWWAADECAGDYYRLPSSHNREPGKAWVIRCLGSLPPERPEVVFASRTDVFDHALVLAQMLEREYVPERKLQGIVIWRRADLPASR